MKPPCTIRHMRRDDMAAILRIQEACYTTIVPESQQSLEAKLLASPETCFVAVMPGGIAGYLVAMPWQLGAPPELDALDCRLPQNPDCLYLHDLAVAPSARGSGTAAALIAAFMHSLKRLNFGHASLVAIQASQPFWQRHGFQPVALDAAKQIKLSAYGKNIVYMQYIVVPASQP